MYQELFTNLGLGASGMFAAAWLIRELAKNILKRDHETYKLKLSKEIAEHKATLESYQTKHSISYKEKIDLYKTVSDPIIVLVVEIERGNGITAEIMKRFEIDRLTITASLVMFASSEVYDSFNELIDYFYNTAESETPFTFPEFRAHAMKLLSDMRKDIGIYTDVVTYKGSR